MVPFCGVEKMTRLYEIRFNHRSEVMFATVTWEGDFDIGLTTDGGYAYCLCKKTGKLYRNGKVQHGMSANEVK